VTRLVSIKYPVTAQQFIIARKIKEMQYFAEQEVFSVIINAKNEHYYHNVTQAASEQDP